MEKSRVKFESFLLVCLTLGLIVGQSTAYNKICYRVCFVCCMIGSESGMEACVALCKKLCSGYLPAGTSSTQTPVPTSFNVTPITDSQYFCTFGCSTVLCTNLSTKDNLGIKISVSLSVSLDCIGLKKIMHNFS